MHENQHRPFEFEFDGTVGIIKNATTNSNGSYDTISVREISTGVWYLKPTGVWYQAKIDVPQNYVGNSSDGELEVLSSAMGRHETIPDYDRTQRIRNLIGIAIGISALVFPYVLIAIFSHGFETGTLSTPLQRGFMMSWLVVGQVFGAISGWMGHADSTEGNIFWGFEWSDLVVDRRAFMENFCFPVLPLLAVITPAVGGFVVVGLMIKQFGSCVLV
jgi:hypothetical protein